MRNTKSRLWRLTRLPRTRIPLSLPQALATAAGLMSPFFGRTDAGTVAAFEQVLAAYAGRRHAVAVGSGKAALALAIDVLELPPGAGVVVPSLLVPEVVAVLAARGLEPIIVDVNEHSFGLDARRVEEALTPTTRAILPVHVFGSPCEVDALEELARRRGLVLLEDAAQALGATVGGRPVGSFGPVSTVSLGLFKNVNTLSGGAILTDDDELASKLRAARAGWSPTARGELLRLWAQWFIFGIVTRPVVFSLLIDPALALPERLAPGWSARVAHKPDPTYIAGTLDMERFQRGFTEVQARLGLHALGAAEQHTTVRSTNARILDRAIDSVPGVARQRPLARSRSIRLNYVLLVGDRERRLPELRRRSGLDLSTGYMRDVGALTAFRRYAHPAPVAARVEREHVYVPIQHDVPAEVFAERAARLAEALREN